MAQRRPFPSVDGYTHVLIAVTDDFPYQGANAVILRRHGLPYDQDVILVKRAKAQPPLLAEAVLTLQAVRSEFGDLPNADQVVRVNQQRTPRGRVDEAVEWLKRIKDAEPGDVRELGTLQYVRVLIPNSR